MTALVTIALLLGAQIAAPVAAQEIPTSQSLEELIPDSAVENPEEWARDKSASEVEVTAGEDDPASPEGEADTLQPDSPLAEWPEMAVDWPEDVDLPPLEPLEPEDDVRFADSEMPELIGTQDAELVRISEELVLAFPAGLENFLVREDFISRFKELSTIRELGSDSDNIAQLAARARADEALLTEMLRVYGYYNAQIIRTIDNADAEENTADDLEGSARFDIIPGQRYRFGDINLGLLGSAPDYAALRAAFEIESGDPVSSDAILQESLDLGVALGETGYPFANVGEAALLIDHNFASGDLTIPVDPAGKYLFGKVVSSLPEFLSGRHLASIARFEEGDIYQRSLDQDLRRAIAATGLVSSATIIPREVAPPTAGQPGTVDLDIALTPAKLRTIAGAIGYGSEEGFRLQASWEHRNLFPPEGALKLRGIAGTQEQLAGVTFRKNNFGGRDKVLTVDAYASSINNSAYDARTLALVGNYEQSSTLLFQKPLSWSVGFEAVATSERPAAQGNIVQPRETYFVGALPVGALIDTTDSLLNPTRGMRLGGRISPEISSNNGTQSFYLRGQMDASYYQSITDKVVIAGRARLGSIPGTDIANIAPSRRYYSGGGGSVRGYGYRKIGPVDVNGDPTGGLSLAEFALEARVRTGFMDGAVSVVPFVDMGSVSSSTAPDFNEVKFGAGLGVRYDSAFGPIRVDVGVPINPGPNDNPVAVYVSLGQAF